MTFIDKTVQADFRVLTDILFCERVNRTKKAHMPYSTNKSMPITERLISFFQLPVYINTTELAQYRAFATIHCLVSGAKEKKSQ